jgi:hypothetical protein
MNLKLGRITLIPKKAMTAISIESVKFPKIFIATLATVFSWGLRTFYGASANPKSLIVVLSCKSNSRAIAGRIRHNETDKARFLTSVLSAMTRSEAPNEKMYTGLRI